MPSLLRQAAACRINRALDHPILGPKLGPILKKMPKSMFFFPIQQKKIPIPPPPPPPPPPPQKKKKKKKKNFFFFGSNTKHIVTYLQFHRIIEYIITIPFLKVLTFIIGINLAMENAKLPYFSQNAVNFPNSMGPDPIPKKGCESPDHCQS